MIVHMNDHINDGIIEEIALSTRTVLSQGGNDAPNFHYKFSSYSGYKR
jgi:hypothetical protein